VLCGQYKNLKRTLLGSRFKEIEKKQFWAFCNFLMLKKQNSQTRKFIIPASSIVDPDPSLF
jgi:hypothetical protein